MRSVQSTPLFLPQTLNRGIYLALFNLRLAHFDLSLAHFDLSLPPMTLTGTIKSVTFHSPQNGFTVLRLTDSASKKVVVVTGTFPNLEPGENIKVEGEWGRHPKFGEQFQAASFAYLTDDSGSITEYLASGQFPGVGQKTAENIVKIFGEDTLDVLDNHPELFRSSQEHAKMLRTWKSIEKND